MRHGNQGNYTRGLVRVLAKKRAILRDEIKEIRFGDATVKRPLLYIGLLKARIEQITIQMEQL